METTKGSMGKYVFKLGKDLKVGDIVVAKSGTDAASVYKITGSQPFMTVMDFGGNIHNEACDIDGFTQVEVHDSNAAKFNHGTRLSNVYINLDDFYVVIVD